jgi:hypothetical protein
MLMHLIGTCQRLVASVMGDLMVSPFAHILSGLPPVKLVWTRPQ